MRHQIAHRRQTQANDRRILRAVNDFVNPARLKAAFQRDESWIGDNFAVNQSAKLPIAARNQTPFAQHRVTNGQLVLGAAEVNRGLRVRSAMAERCIEDF